MHAAEIINKVGSNRFFAVLLLLLAGIAAAKWLTDPDVTPLKVARIEGEFRYMKRADLERAVAGVTQGGFFTADVQAVTEAAEALPWVAKASVRRVWPDAIHVWVVEQSPLGRWKEDGLINPDGEVFSPKGVKVKLKLPLLAGPEGSGKVVIEKYWLARTKLQSLGLNIVRLELSKRRAWRLHLENGAVIKLGVEDFAGRLQRFANVYPTLEAKWKEKLEAVDLRYANGMAVKWENRLVGKASQS